MLTFAITLFFVLDPFGNIPVFQAVLARIPEERRRAVLARELVFALGILLFFLVAGPPILGFLGLSSHTLSIAGGVVLFLIALGMVFPSRSVLTESGDEEPFIVPMAVPLFAGPSAIALMLLATSQFPGRLAMNALAVTLAWLAAALVLWFTPLLIRVLGAKGTRALERLMGLLLILVAVEMMLDGLLAFQSLPRMVE